MNGKECKKENKKNFLFIPSDTDFGSKMSCSEVNAVGED